MWPIIVLSLPIHCQSSTRIIGALHLTGSQPGKIVVFRKNNRPWLSGSVCSIQPGESARVIHGGTPAQSVVITSTQERPGTRNTQSLQSSGLPGSLANAPKQAKATRSTEANRMADPPRALQGYPAWRPPQRTTVETTQQSNARTLPAICWSEGCVWVVVKRLAGIGSLIPLAGHRLKMSRPSGSFVMRRWKAARTSSNSRTRIGAR